MEFFIITTASDGVCARRAAHIVVVIVLLILRTWKMLVQRLKYTEAVKLLRDTRCNDCFTHKIGMRKCFTSMSVLYHLWTDERAGTITYEKRVDAEQRRACVGHLAQSSRSQTNNLLKSGPALAGPAGPATPPLVLTVVVCFS